MSAMHLYVTYGVTSLFFAQGLETGCDFTKDDTVAIVQATLQAMEGELEKNKKLDFSEYLSSSLVLFFSQTRQAYNGCHQGIM